MKYMGSKAKVARYIVPIIQEQIERSGYETYLEPFCGGCNVIDKIEAPQRIASDCNKYLIALMQHIQAGGELPGYIEREEYAKVRANRDDYPEWYAGYVGFVASLARLKQPEGSETIRTRAGATSRRSGTS